MEKFNKQQALEYLIENRVDCDEWSAAGMFECVVDIIKSEENFFEKDVLDNLLLKAKNF